MIDAECGMLLFIPNLLSKIKNRKRISCSYRKKLIRAARRLNPSTSNRQQPLPPVNEKHTNYVKSTSEGNMYSVHLACQRYFGASGIWGSPFFAGNRWKDAEAWIHHGSVYDWIGPGGPYSWTRKNSQKRNKETKSKEWYALLNVPRNASLEHIKKAFRRKIIRIHPDVNSLYRWNNHIKEYVYDLLTAYHVLRDPTTRAEYDRNLESYQDTSRSEEEERGLPMSDKLVMF
ncbi:hypothetical protein Gasu2_67260 [Galdieria sulphuraria]|uniref:Heat shock protein binding protein n=1 Tax=Galdieria sulphuraria TaxID=130081 RepID=M2Y9Q2_GALSU|nr:heat shock protein binding protein [Galdieria sulphuraria]EME32798.1 heat shock protein binding protein [Galdieria sulphuraria]GJD12652.1 hypothetical protein Gasu2_67260 [Galdieria sulphuraria]|eukprot:XP_005709318.1 heat shock protein binding protein [Galdieria sulphuraria]